MDPSSVAVAIAASASKGQQSSDLLTSIVARLWPNINVAVCKVVKESVEPTFKDLPSPLKTLHFTQLDLGTVPIHIDNVIVHEKEKDSVQFDMDVVWDGDCNIQLKADYVGSVGVQKIKLHGRLSVLLSPILDVLPVVSAAQVCFINPPKFELDFLGLANLADGMFLSTKIRDIISDVIDGLLVLPNRMYFKVDAANSFLDTYKPPLGVARITVVEGTGFLGKGGVFSDAHDTYCHLNLGSNKKPLWKTSTQNNTEHPTWNETVDFLLFDHDQIIEVHAWDDDVDHDDDLGSAQTTVREMLLTPGKKKTLKLHGGTYKGGSVTLQCEVRKLTTNNFDSLDENQDENLLSGLLTILVTGVKDVPLKDKEAAKTSVKVLYGTETEFVTGIVSHAEGVDALNPVYDCAFRVPLKPSTFKKESSIKFQLLNNGEDEDDVVVLGTTSLSFEDLVSAAGIMTEKRKIGDGATIEFRAILDAVAEPMDAGDLLSKSDGKVHTTSSSVTSSNARGTVRLTVIKGWGFEVEKRRLMIRRKDIPDIYCNITFGSSPTVWRTKTIPNSTQPEWKESADYLLSEHGQVISITLFDEDKKKDDELGSARITVGKLLLAGGPVDVELLESGKPTGHYVSLRCSMLDAYSAS